nr:hypothetical protein [Streptomyces sp. TLI_235]
MSDDTMASAPADLAPDSDSPAVDRTRKRPWLLPLATGVAGIAFGAGAVGLWWNVADDAPVTAAASSSPSPSAEPFTLMGALTLNQVSLGDGPCSGRGGYNDIGEGTPVTVYNASGEVVAKGRLGTGVRSGAACQFSVSVPDVPAGTKFFQVEVSHRGKITIEAEDARMGRFSASLG